jgi:hypothetical protein
VRKILSVASEVGAVSGALLVRQVTLLIARACSAYDWLLYDV